MVNSGLKGLKKTYFTYFLYYYNSTHMQNNNRNSRAASVFSQPMFIICEPHIKQSVFYVLFFSVISKCIRSFLNYRHCYYSF